MTEAELLALIVDSRDAIESDYAAARALLGTLQAILAAELAEPPSRRDVAGVVGLANDHLGAIGKSYRALLARLERERTAFGATTSTTLQ